MAFALRQRLDDTLETLGAVAQLLGEALRSLRYQRPSWSEFIRQLYAVGVKSQSVVITTGAADSVAVMAGLGRVVGEVAVSYGFDPNLPEEELFALQVAGLGVSSHGRPAPGRPKRPEPPGGRE